MEERPESVTVIGWLLVVFGALGLLGCLAMMPMRDLPMIQQSMTLYHYPVSFQTMMVVGVAGTAMRLLCGVAFLRRLGWARYVFVLCELPLLTYTAWVTPWPIFVIPSVLLMLAAVVFLFRPAASHWFAGEDAATAS
jgi:hypothetical protein